MVTYLCHTSQNDLCKYTSQRCNMQSRSIPCQSLLLCVAHRNHAVPKAHVHLQKGKAGALAGAAEASTAAAASAPEGNAQSSSDVSSNSDDGASDVSSCSPVPRLSADLFLPRLLTAARAAAIKAGTIASDDAHTDNDALQQMLMLTLRQALRSASSKKAAQRHSADAAVRVAAQTLVNFTLSHAESALPPAMSQILRAQLFQASWNAAMPVTAQAPVDTTSAAAFPELSRNFAAMHLQCGAQQQHAQWAAHASAAVTSAACSARSSGNGGARPAWGAERNSQQPCMSMQHAPPGAVPTSVMLPGMCVHSNDATSRAGGWAGMARSRSTSFASSTHRAQATAAPSVFPEGHELAGELQPAPKADVVSKAHNKKKKKSKGRVANADAATVGLPKGPVGQHNGAQAAPGVAAAAAPAANGSSSWQCALCTFVHQGTDALFLSCAMCGTPKPAPHAADLQHVLALPPPPPLPEGNGGASSGGWQTVGGPVRGSEQTAARGRVRGSGDRRGRRGRG